jgi:hypothetical protein
MPSPAGRLWEAVGDFMRERTLEIIAAFLGRRPNEKYLDASR